MADLLARGAAWLAEQRGRHLTRAVVYVRGDAEIALRATVGRTEYEEADAMGALRRLESRDYLLDAASLRVADVPFLPRVGDRIRETLDGRRCEYEVLSPAGAPPWRYIGPDRRTLRVHTRLRSEE